MAIPFGPKQGKETKEPLVEQTQKNGVLQTKKVEGTTEKTKENIEKLGLEKPITKENLEIGENIPREVVEHILKHNFKVQNPRFIKCVDGRTPEDNIKGIYMPGGTDGLLIVIFKILTDYNVIDYNVHITPEQIRNILVELIGGEENYYYHTDEHNRNTLGACGCGHVNLTLKASTAFYNLSDNETTHIAKLAPKYAKFLQEERLDNKDKMEVLKGEHEEQGIILINLENVSIVPRGADTSFFIYNQKNAQILLKKLIKKIEEKLKIKIDINKALEELNKQVLSTFYILGRKAPFYRISYNPDTNKYVLKYDGLVEEIIN